MRKQINLLWFIKVVILLMVWGSAPGCAFKFEISSQKTALENQVLGSYEVLDPEKEVSFARLQNEPGSSSEDGKRAKSPVSQYSYDPVKNRQFNQDDIEELKDEGLLGEGFDGQLKIVDINVQQRRDELQNELKLARLLVEEENRDRNLIWRKAIDNNVTFTDEDLSDVISAFVAEIYKNAKEGHWLQKNDGTWYQKQKM